MTKSLNKQLNRLPDGENTGKSKTTSCKDKEEGFKRMFKGKRHKLSEIPYVNLFDNSILIFSVVSSVDD